MGTEAPTPDGTKKGHPTGFWFFFWGEFAERCSFYGMRAILFNYLAHKMGFGVADGGTYYSIFVAACYLLPLVGGYIADNYLGKYWTIVGFSIPYIVGQFLVGIENVYVLVFALGLLAMGTGVIKPNISTLLGLTYEQQRPGQDQLRSSAFAWFYFAINVGAALSQAVVPWLAETYSYQVAFLFPAVLMILALTVFALGKPFYATEAIVHKETTPEARAERIRVLSRIFGLFILVMFFWAVFDQASSIWIEFCNVYMDKNFLGYSISGAQTQTFNPVFILLLLPITSTIYLWLGRKGINIKPTKKMFFGFILTTSTMLIMTVTASLTGEKESRIGATIAKGTIILTDGNVTLEKGTKGADKKLTMANGKLTFTTATITTDEGTLNIENGEGTFAEGSLSFDTENKITFSKGKFEFAAGQFTSNKGSVSFTGGKVGTKEGEIPHEGKKLPIKKDAVELNEFDWTKPDGRISVWWIVLAYFIMTLAEVHISVTGLELAFVAAPKSMNSFVTACWLVTVFLANFVINAPMVRLYPLMSPTAYFAISAAIMAGVTVAFMFVGRRFERSGETETPLMPASE